MCVQWRAPSIRKVLGNPATKGLGKAVCLFRERKPWRPWWLTAEGTGLPVEENTAHQSGSTRGPQSGKYKKLDLLA